MFYLVLAAQNEIVTKDRNWGGFYWKSVGLILQLLSRESQPSSFLHFTQLTDQGVCNGEKRRGKREGKGERQKERERERERKKERKTEREKERERKGKGKKERKREREVRYDIFWMTPIERDNFLLLREHDSSVFLFFLLFDDLSLSFRSARRRKMSHSQPQKMREIRREKERRQEREKEKKKRTRKREIEKKE